MGEGTPWEQPVVSFLRPTKNKGDPTQASHRLGKPFPIERHPWSLVYLAWILLCRLSVMSQQWNVHGRLVGAGVMDRWYTFEEIKASLRLILSQSDLTLFGSLWRHPVHALL